MDCPDENALVAFATGQLDAPAHNSVLAHIDRCPDCAAMVADAAVAMGEPGDTEPTHQVSPGPLPTEVPAPRGPLPRGTSLGRYVVLDLLGTGGLGQVYTAYDPELDRRVAVKLLRPSRSGAAMDQEAQRWLMREAQAMAQLSHPNVVPVHDVGTFGHEVFIAMKLVDGGTLRQWLKGTTRSWKEIRDVMVDAGRGLLSAHAAGLVHRDFKPANLLVDPQDNAFVVDFGLARAVAGPTDATRANDPLVEASDRLLDEDLTQTGAIIGTPAYMPPEQLTGRQVDPRSDQFAFCVTLYEALFGRRPFAGRKFGELLEAIAAGPPTPSGSSGVPPWLRRAATKGLASDPAQRFASMDELLHAMTVDRRSRKRQRLAIGVAALLSATVAGTVGFVLQPEVTTTERTQVETIVEAARDAASRAYFIYPPDDEPDYPTAYVRVLELESTDGAPAQVAREVATELRHEFASTLVRLGDAYWERDGGIAFASDYYAAAVIFDPALDHARKRMLLTPGQLGALSGRAGSLSFSEAELAAAQALIALAEPDEPTRRDKVDRWLARPDRPIATRSQLDQMFPPLDVASPQRPSAPPTVVAEAAPLEDPAPATSTGRARPKRRPATEVDPPEELAARRDPEAAKAAVTLGRAVLKQGRPGEAITHFHRALESDHKSRGAIVGLARAHFELGDYPRAATFGERVVRVAPNNAEHRIQLGDAYFQVLRYADARKQYEKAKARGHRLGQIRLDQLDKKTASK